ncbi:MAG TPA: metallophosphoesterase [Rhizomicrobium sp.]|nr:metallophosphoesterase [Rhizomicrobium sp.]
MRNLPAFLVLAVSLSSATSAGAQALLAHWVQMAPGGVSEARVVVQGDTCPAAVIDGANVPMRTRAAPNGNFPVRLCAVTLAPTVKTVSILGAELHPPKLKPERILVLGDTGCRIKGSTVQACNDPKQWPFPQVAAQAAKLKPDVVIHVGDYLYRESACPAGDARCAGSPSGDNWATWAADFFTPGKPLLEAAPWVIVRGNHEECARAGTGFLRLIGPLRVVEGAPCVEHVAPYAVQIGKINLIVTDNASAVDVLPSSALVDTYKQDFAALPKLATGETWIAGHHPIWGVAGLKLGMVVGGNATLMDAEDGIGIPPNVDLLLAGHIHTFEAINYAGGLPPQLVVGEGGDLLDSAPSDLSGRSVGAAKITTGLSLPGWGFTLLTHTGDHWTADVYDSTGARERTCTIAARRISC